MNFWNNFPFVGIVGQQEAKKALLCSLINPNIGSLLLLGATGSGKSLLLNSMTDLLKKNWVKIPLSVSEGRMLGSLDLEQMLCSGEARREKGMLEEAHGGWVLLDDANILSPRLFQTLRQIHRSQTIELQREGLHMSIPAEFFLLGTANPQEGGIDPAFLESFGLCLILEDTSSPSARLKILEENLKFQENPSSYHREFQKAQHELTGTIHRAKAQLKQVQVSYQEKQRMVLLAQESGSHGHEAEKLLYETARALAALRFDEIILPTDLQQAAKWVLVHRLRERLDIEEIERQKEVETEIPREPSEKLREEDEQDDVQDIDEWMTSLKLQIRMKHQQLMGYGKRMKTRSSTSQGRKRGFYPWRKGEGGIALLPTLRHAARHQKHRNKPRHLAIALEKEDYMEHQREKRSGAHLLFLVDASGSMGARKRMRAVKGAILALLQDAYQKRDSIAMMAFRGKDAQLLLGSTRSLEMAERKLRHLPTGGETPLAQGLEKAREFLIHQQVKDPQIKQYLVLVSDCRGNVAKNHDAESDALIQAEKLARLGIESLVLDTQPPFLGFQQGRKLAEAMGAEYWSLENMTDVEIKSNVLDLMNKS